MQAKKNKLTFLIAIFLVFLLIILIALSSLGFFQNKRKSFGEIQPEKISVDELYKILGEPIQKSEENGIDMLYYATDSKFYQNSVAIDNEKVLYTREFFSKPETLNKYKSFYGEPDLLLFDTEVEDAKWMVYLTKGLAFNISGNEVFQILRFHPTDKPSFLKIGEKIGMSEKQSEGVVEIPLEAL